MGVIFGTKRTRRICVTAEEELDSQRRTENISKKIFGLTVMASSRVCFLVMKYNRATTLLSTYDSCDSETNVADRVKQD
jgi:hypothetical protein